MNLIFIANILWNQKIFTVGILKIHFMVLAVLRPAPPIAISFVPCYLFSLVTSNDVKNKFIRNYSAVPDIWRTKMGGSLCFLLCRFQKMFIKLITIRQFWENHVKEDLNCPFCLLVLETVSNPALTFHFRSAVSTYFSPSVLFMSHRQIKGGVFKTKLILFPLPALQQLSPFVSGTTFHSLPKLLHLTAFSPVPSAHLQFSLSTFLFPSLLSLSMGGTSHPGSCSRSPGLILYTSLSTLPSVWYF